MATTEQKQLLAMALESVVGKINGLMVQDYDYASIDVDVSEYSTSTYTSTSQYQYLEKGMKDSSKVEKLMVKSQNEEAQEMTAIIMRADHTDGHGLYTSKSEVKKAQRDFSNHVPDGTCDLMHAIESESRIVEHYIAPCDLSIMSKSGEVAVEAREGDWIGVAKLSDTDWALAQDGVIDSFSINALGLETEVAA